MDGFGREQQALQARNGHSSGRNDAISGRRPDARSLARGRAYATLGKGAAKSCSWVRRTRRGDSRNLGGQTAACRASCASFPECDGLLCDFAAAAAKSDVINGVARGGGGDGDAFRVRSFSAFPGHGGLGTKCGGEESPPHIVLCINELS